MTQAPAAPGLLTIEQVMQRLNIKNRQVLANWRCERKGPTWVKVSGELGRNGGIIRYPEDALERYLADRTVTGEVA